VTRILGSASKTLCNRQLNRFISVSLTPEATKFFPAGEVDSPMRQKAGISSWASRAFIRKRHRLRPRHVAGLHSANVKSCIFNER
jgi:hypothetical protein